MLAAYQSSLSNKKHAILSGVLGCRQVVRHMVLVHAFGGSNPSTPAMENTLDLFDLTYFLLLEIGFEPRFC